ncbi:MAG: hypothetical protein AB1457_04975 [Chloroflexota bacterium]
MARWSFVITVCLVLWLAACNPNQQPTTQTATLPPQDGGFIQPPAGALQARRELARELNVSPQSITIQAIESITWQNSCLEAGDPGEICAEQEIPGLIVTLRYGDRSYTYHTDLDGVLVRPILSVDEPSTSALQTVQYLAGLLGYNSQAIQLLSERQTTFSDGCLEIAIAEIPCTQLPVEGRIIRLGVENHIFEFRISTFDSIPVLASVDGYLSSTPALNWSREGSSQEYCDGLKVYLNGWSVQYYCRGQASQNPGIMRLSPEQLSRLLRWFIRLQPFEFDQSSADGSQIRMTLNSLGLEEADTPLRLEISEFAVSLLAPIQRGTVTPFPFP